MKIGDAVLAWRKRRAWTQRQLAEKAGMQHGNICRIERGNCEPRPTTIHRLAEALDVTVEELQRGKVGR